MGARQNRQGTQDGSSILLTQKDIFSHKLITFSYLQNKVLPLPMVLTIFMYATLQS